MAVTLCHTQLNTYLIGCALRGCLRGGRKRVNNKAANVKRIEQEGDQGQVWRSREASATELVSDSFSDKVKGSGLTRYLKVSNSGGKKKRRTVLGFAKI